MFENQEQFLLERTSATKEQIHDLFAAYEEGGVEVVWIFDDDLAEDMENFMACPEDKIDEWMVHFYTHHFDLCFAQAKELLLHLFEEDALLKPSEATGYLFRRGREMDIAAGKYTFLSKECPCEDH